MIKLIGIDGQPLVRDTAYQGASHTRREFASWQPTLGSADADLTHELSTLVSRSRDLIRNNGVASGAVQTLVDNVVARACVYRRCRIIRRWGMIKPGLMSGHGRSKPCGAVGQRVRRVMPHSA